MKVVAAFRGAARRVAGLMFLFLAFSIRGQTVPFDVGFWYPTNGETFGAPANIGMHARVSDSNVVLTVQYFANATPVGLVTNTSGLLLTNLSQANPFEFTWSNVLAGSYTLTAVVFDRVGNMAASGPVNITVTNPIVRPSVYIYSPANNAKFAGPTNLTLYARAAESGGTVATVEFYANNASLGVVSNSSQMVFTNISVEPLFPLVWPGVSPGSYALKAVATDINGNSATSSVVNIVVLTNSSPPPVPFTVSFWYPTNGETFTAPANIGVHALAPDSNVVETVQYFANGASIGIVTNISSVLLTNSTEGNPFFMDWSNVPAGNYALTALAMDSAGNTATSGPVNITVNAPTNPPVPFTVSFWYPTNGEIYVAPANIGVHARVTDSNVVETVQYFANGASIGIVTNISSVLLTNSAEGNPFFMDWSNVAADTYALTALATDSAGNTATSGPVNIYVVTNVPTVTIYATDPVAVEGTNGLSIYMPATCVTNYISGTNTATLLVRRNSQTNNDLTVYYSIGGTASNGVDYVALPGYVTISAGQRYALVTIIPLEDTDSSFRHYDTVILTLAEPTTPPPTYLIGSPSNAGAIILEENYLPMLQPMIHTMPDGSLHLSLPATNGMNYCLESSTDMVNWTPVCTNTVLKGSAQFVDPNETATPGLYYRIVSSPAPASY